MALDPKEIQERINAGAAPPHVRNINLDTHIGQAPQRPYALLEDQMATITLGYKDVAALRAALSNAPKAEGLPDGAPDPNDVVEEDGELVRYVVNGDEREHFATESGELRERLHFVKRYVASTQQGARIATENGRPTDYFNGFTWLRNGFKPERDFAVISQMGAAGDKQKLTFDQPLAPTEAAVVRHQVNRANVATPPVPVEPSVAERRTERHVAAAPDRHVTAPPKPDDKPDDKATPKPEVK